MRQIGTLPRTSDPTVLGDYLLSQGVTSRVIESNDGWDIWIHNEDHIPKAREAFSVFEQNPADPLFADATRQAVEARQKAEKLDRQYRKNVRDLSTTWDRVSLRRRPLTMLLVGVCVGLYLAGKSSELVNDWFLEHLRFFPRMNPNDLPHGLDAIHRGEIWRLITPIFLHVDFLHLLFNMWALLILGTIIETRRGTLKLLVMIVLSALCSNIVQYLFDILIDQALIPWVGISGVVYALFGYLWIKGQVEPEAGMVLHHSTVRIILLWLMLGFVFSLPLPGGGVIRMANGAHLGGLIMGMLFGFARL